MKDLYASDESLTQMHDFHQGYYEYGDLNVRSQTLQDFNRGLKLLEEGLGAEKSPNVLDVGYGNGFFLAAARERGWRVNGMDPSKKKSGACKTKI